MDAKQPTVADAVRLICEEKGISVDAMIEIIEAALAAAYRKDFGERNQNIKVEFDLETGGSNVFDVKTVVEDVDEEELKEIKEAEAAAEAEAKIPASKRELKPRFKKEEDLSPGDSAEEEKPRFNPKTDLQISEAKEIKKGYKIGDEIKTKLEVPAEFGRMAAQTAKQVITQKVRETERMAMFEEFKDKEGEIIMGTVQRQEGRLVLIDLGRLTALLPPEEQISSERYLPGGHIKVYIISVNSTTKGPEVIVSRAHPEIVKTLFYLEIPEVANGTVEIKGIAREAGSRTKLSVWTEDESIDPIGSCIGQRGARIQTIISELKGEKVDVIKYSEDPVEYITNALSPAKIIEIDINDEEKTATAKVGEDQLSLAIGKAGQNVRLAARLTGWKINIISSEGKVIDSEELEDEESSKEDDEKKDEELLDEEPKEEKTEEEIKEKKKEEEVEEEK